MKALVSGKVLQVTAKMSKNSKAYSDVSFLSQSGDGRPVVVTARCWNGKVPAVGAAWEVLAEIRAFSFRSGGAGLSVDVF